MTVRCLSGRQSFLNRLLFSSLDFKTCWQTMMMQQRLFVEKNTHMPTAAGCGSIFYHEGQLARTLTQQQKPRFCVSPLTQGAGGHRKTQDKP